MAYTVEFKFGPGDRVAFTGGDPSVTGVVERVMEDERGRKLIEVRYDEFHGMSKALRNFYEEDAICAAQEIST